MFTDKMVVVLAKLTYQPDADWEVNILPFGSIYWKDEMPAIVDIFDRPEDMSILHRMFGIRLKIWDGEALNTQDKELWDAVKTQVSNWALFKRLILSAEQKQAREHAERQVEREFDALGPEQNKP
jgi:hypothetical protein